MRSARLATLSVLLVVLIGATSCAVGPTASVLPVTGIAGDRVTISTVMPTTGRLEVTFESLAGVNPDFVMVEAWTYDLPVVNVLREGDGFQAILNIGTVDAGSSISVRLGTFCDNVCGWDASSKLFRYTVSVVP
jgi:hypothetical protein